MKKILVLSLLIVSLSSFADEGQWQPHQIKELQDEFTRLGIELPAKQIGSLEQYPMNAVISLGGCSASFVSNMGLVITNHHCAYAAIQNNSTAENNLIENGFLAKTKAEELPAGPQQKIYITEQVTDVTQSVLADLGKLSGKERFDAIQDKRKILIKQCESEDKYRCSVQAYHHGMEYFLTKQLMIKDVRLVYAPTDSMGNFGGDIDNYEYPRHVADFTFLRAYVGKDGSTAEYNSENVPFQPKSHLRISAKGVKRGDGVLIAGYPGSTSRYRLASEIAFAGLWSYPTQVAMYNKTLDTISEATEDNADLEVMYSSIVKSINNRMKKRNGLMDGFKATDIHGIKKQQEQSLLDWIVQSKERDVYAKTHQQLSSIIDKSQLNQKRDFYFDYVQNSSLLDAASKLYRLAVENEKPDAMREIGYQERDVDNIKARLKRLQKSFAVSVDAQLWSMFISEYLTQPKETRVAQFDQALGLMDSMSKEQIDSLIQPIYQNSQLDNEAVRLSWLGKSAAEFKASKDAFIQLAVALHDLKIQFENEEKEMDGLLAEYRPLYMEAIIAYNRSQGKAVYPDANSSLRVSFGSVDGYPAQDGIYKTAFTSLEGLAAKVTGKAPFAAPERLLKAIVDKDYGKYQQTSLSKTKELSWGCKLFGCEQIKPEPFNSVPVNFLSSVDTTGGNSGSPMMNGKGELVGLNFDSTYESITKDWYFNPKITRAVHVDIRYILWLMEHVDHAENLIEEMTIVE